MTESLSPATASAGASRPAPGTGRAFLATTRRRLGRWLASLGASLCLAGQPMLAAAQVTPLPDASSLTGGRYNFADLSLGSYTGFATSIGAVGVTASQVYAGSDPRLVRTTPSNYGPGFCWCDNLLFAYAVDAVRLDFETPVQSFGLGAIGNTTGGYAIGINFYAGQTLLGTTYGGGTAGWQGNTGVAFAGAFSATPFDRVEIVGPSGGFAMNYWAIGAAAPVPEPAGAALLAAGLARAWRPRRAAPARPGP